ncbi:MAG: DUF6231 family protein [Moraxellaceae bacterium]
MTAWPFDILPLIERLAQDKPIESGLLVGADCRRDTWPDAWQHCPPTQLNQLPFQQRYDLSVCHLSTEVCTIEATQGLTRLRDLLARRVLVIVTDQALVDMPEQLRALGFSQLDQPTDSNTAQPWQIWQFNILAYKQVPDWLNAKFWANPENFNKYRW